MSFKAFFFLPGSFRRKRFRAGNQGSAGGGGGVVVVGGGLFPLWPVL
jgi:hypothetical protein